MTEKTKNPGIDGLKAIDALIAKVPGTYAKAHELVQQAAIAIVEHSQAYGDCSRALTLVRAIPINQARALITYFMTVSPIGVLLSKNKKDDKVRLLKPESKAYNDYDLAKARALSWWTMDAEKAAKEAEQVFSGGVFDMIFKMLDRVIEGKGGTSKEFTKDAIETAEALKSNIVNFRAATLAAKAVTAPDAVRDVLPVGKAA